MKSKIKIIKSDKKFVEAFKNLRKGYPHKSFAEQTKGDSFRKSSEIITEKIAKEVIKKIDIENIVVMLPWRSALAFVPSYTKLGVKNFYHISSKRNEKTLETEVDFEEGKIDRSNIVIISDPMLATGNTINDCINRCLCKGVWEENIIVASVLSAPEGIKNIHDKYPKVKIITGSLDEKLDEKGYIVPGLGDFGDKYFSDFGKNNLEFVLDKCNLYKKGRNKITDRIKKHGVSEILNMIIERDEKDDQIDKINRESLTKDGLKIIKPEKSIVIDTGDTVGIKKVVNIIEKHIDQETRIISLEGKSGVGKSSTTEALAKKLKAPKFSMGDIFRYLTLLHVKNIKFSRDIFRDFEYKNISGEIKLFYKNLDIKKEYGSVLREVKIESRVPEIAKKYQKEVIEFCSSEISRIRKNLKGIILIEGRAFTLDFLSADLRIKLVADAPIRAERRWWEK